MTDYWECPKCLHKQIGTECRCQGPECPCSKALSRDARASIIRALSHRLEGYFDNELQDEAFEALLAAGIDTESEDQIDDVEDLALSLKIEAVEDFLAELGWELAPRTKKLD